MRRRRLLLAIPILHVLLAGPIQAGEADETAAPLRGEAAGQANVMAPPLLNETLRVNKQALVAVNLGLTDAESAAFWPVYGRYQSELEAVQARLGAVIDAYAASFGSTTDEQAMKLVTDYLTIERDRVEIRRKYLEPISEALPGRKVMRFYQIENKIDAVLRYELAATIPVVEQ